MLDYLLKAKQYLWVFVEIGFLAVVSVVLIYLILGPIRQAYSFPGSPITS